MTNFGDLLIILVKALVLNHGKFKSLIM